MSLSSEMQPVAERQRDTGRCSNVGDVMRAALRLLADCGPDPRAHRDARLAAVEQEATRA